MAVPSFTEALQRRAWVTEALCARPPNDSLPWIRERSNGRETPASVLACLEVCALGFRRHSRTLAHHDVLFLDESDAAYCSAACRQASYRVRVA